MLKIDRAAAAFQAAKDRYTVEPDGDLFKVVEAGEAPTVHAEQMSDTDALALVDQLGNRDGVEAVLREMISPIVIKAACDKAALRIDKTDNNRLNLGCQPPLALLKGIIAVLEQEAH